MKHVVIYFKLFQYCRDHVVIRCAHPVFWSYSPIPNEVLDELGLVHDYYLKRTVGEFQFSLICDILPYVSHY